MAPRQRCMSPTSPDEDAPSSPTTLIRKKVLLEKQESSLSPEAEIARDKHDIFNLIVLIPVIVLTVMNYNWEKVATGYNPEHCWTGNHFMLYWWVLLVYFVVDLIWVAWVPICVKSPGVIIKHHLIALVYLIAPLAWPEYRWFMGAILSVEVNTWFLIARRVVFKRRIQGFIKNCVESNFYISWILIRCIIYPSILGTFLQMAYVGILETQSIMHLQLLFLPIHGFLCALNLKWTYDLFSPMIVRWIKQEDTATNRVSSGL